MGACSANGNAACTKAPGLRPRGGNAPRCAPWRQWQSTWRPSLRPPCVHVRPRGRSGQVWRASRLAATPSTQTPSASSSSVQTAPRSISHTSSASTTSTPRRSAKPSAAPTVKGPATRSTLTRLPPPTHPHPKRAPRRASRPSRSQRACCWSSRSFPRGRPFRASRASSPRPSRRARARSSLSIWSTTLPSPTSASTASRRLTLA
mmetsp:Transcript_34783/g.96014  ORF Transcript_34783/g.96014 Transcript_34783/m.96014 type:complete len:205 (+) Transcript_34783:45-659(+)